MPPILELKNISKSYTVERGVFRKEGVLPALKSVSFSIQKGETLGIVGESGSGKTTLGKLVQGLIRPSGGEIFFHGENASQISRERRARLVQTIFQDPFSSLNPKLSVGAMLEEALSQNRSNSANNIRELLSSVGMPADILHDYPHQFSGGQRQRLGIARALAMRPELIIADEPVSALDLSVQAQILNLLSELKEKFEISYILIAHDLSIVEQMAERAIVLKSGEAVEEGPVEALFREPRHPYTKSLVSSVLPLPAKPS